MPKTSVMHVGVHPGKNEPCSMPAVCGAVAECLKAHFEARFLLHFKPYRVSRFRCLWERLQRLQPVTPCNSLPSSEGKKSCLKVFLGDGPLARRKYKTPRHILSKRLSNVLAQSEGSVVWHSRQTMEDTRTVIFASVAAATKKQILEWRHAWIPYAMRSADSQLKAFATFISAHILFLSTMVCA